MQELQSYYFILKHLLLQLERDLQKKCIAFLPFTPYSKPKFFLYLYPSQAEEAKKSSKKASRKAIKSKQALSTNVLDETIKGFNPDEPKENLVRR